MQRGRLLVAALWICAIGGDGSAQDRTPESLCAAGWAAMDTANAPALLAAADACAAAQEDVQARALIVVANFRGAIDIALFEPATASDQDAVAALRERLATRYVAAVPRAVASDPEMAAAFFEALESWDPEFGPDYDPGWRFLESDRHLLYGLAIRDLQASALHELRRRAALLADIEYRTLRDGLAYVENNARRLRETRGFALEPGTDHYERDEALREALAASEARILADFPTPPLRRNILEASSPETYPGARPLHVGLNGPARRGWMVLRSAEEVRETWLSDAVSEATLARLLAQVDFETESLLLAWAGLTENATGSVLVRRIYYEEALGYWHHHTLVGVVDPECGAEPAAANEARGADAEDRPVAYPYVLAAGPRPRGEIVRSRDSSARYRDGCGPAVRSAPTRVGDARGESLLSGPWPEGLEPPE